MRDAIAAAAWLNGVMMLLGLAIVSVPTLAPAIAAELGLSTGLIGIYSAIMWTASVATTMSAGWLIARYGALRISQLCLLAAMLGLALGAAGSVPFLVAAAILIGLGQGAETPSSSALLVQLTPTIHRTFVISVKQTGGQIGGMLAGLLLPALALAAGWRGALLALAVPLAVFALLLERPRRSLERGAGTRARAGTLSFLDAARLIWRDSRLLKLAACCNCYIAVQVCQQAFLVSYLVAECARSLTVAGVLLSVTQVGGLLGRIFLGGVTGRGLGAMRTLILAGAGMALCALSIGAWGSSLGLPALGLLCFLFGMTSAGWVGVHIAETARLVPVAAVGQITGAMLVSGVSGLILGPVAFAALAAVTSLGFAYVAAAGIALLGVTALSLPVAKSSSA